MGDGTVVVPETFFRILEMPADDVDEWVDRHNDAGLKRIQVIHSHQPRLHVPLVTTEHLVIRLDVWRRNVIFTEQIPVEIRILVAGFLVFIKNGEPGDIEWRKKLFPEHKERKVAIPSNRDPS